MKTFWEKLSFYFKCCKAEGAAALVEDADIEFGPSSSIPKLKELNDDNIFNEKYYRDIEKEKGVKWSYKSIVDFVENEFKEKETNKEDYKTLFDKNELTINTKGKGSLITDQFYLILAEYKAKMDIFKVKPTLEGIGEVISDPIKRIKWDDGMRKYYQIDTEEKEKIFHIWMKSPFPFVADRDSVEKIATFIYNDTFYFFLSSANDDVIPIPEKVERMIDFLCIHSISIKDDYVYFKSVSQSDIKTVLPQALINVTFPAKLTIWFKKVCEAFNKENAPELMVLTSSNQALESSERNPANK